MSEQKVTSLTRRRLRKKPVEYTVVIIHDEDGMEFVVHDVQDTTKDRLAVANDLENAASLLRELIENEG